LYLGEEAPLGRLQSQYGCFEKKGNVLSLHGFNPWTVNVHTYRHSYTYTHTHTHEEKCFSQRIVNCLFTNFFKLISNKRRVFAFSNKLVHKLWG